MHDRYEDIAIKKSSVETNLREIRQNVAHLNIKIVAVTKYFGLDATKTAYEAGLRDFGESRTEESAKKIEQLSDCIRGASSFHFIGHLQSNKAGKAVKYFDTIHSIDSVKIANAVSKAACALNKREKVLLQVNNALEEQKFGYTKEQLKSELGDILALKGLEVIGLMNIAPLGASESRLHELFSDIRCFRDELEKMYGIKLPELSMGMSGDYIPAVQEGATIIRIGRKLFT